MSDGSIADVTAGPRTVAEALGQIVWILSQSPTHRHLRIADLERTVMPAIIHEQFRIFRFGPLGSDDGRASAATGGIFDPTALETLPLGVALWGHLSEAAEARVERGEALTLDDWKSGDRLWLLELVVPFATAENRLVDRALLDLVGGPFRNRPFNLHRVDPETGERKKANFQLPAAA